MKECKTRFAIGQVVKVIRVVSGVHPVDKPYDEAAGKVGTIHRVTFDTTGVHFHVKILFPDNVIRLVEAVIRRTPPGTQPTSYPGNAVSTATGNGVTDAKA
jgi:hypothetical protein